MTMHLRIEPRGAHKVELDELGIELLLSGEIEEIDPILRMPPELREKLVAAIQPFTESGEVNNQVKTLDDETQPALARAMPLEQEVGSDEACGDKSQDIGIEDAIEEVASSAYQQPSVDYKARYLAALAAFSKFTKHAAINQSLDILKLSISHIIEADGTTSVKRLYVLACPRERAYFFPFYIVADEESDAIEGFEFLGISAHDISTGQELAYIPIDDEPRLKRFAIFFEAIFPGQEKRIELKYKWPGLMKQVLARGSTEFWWLYNVASEGSTTDVNYQWLFKPGFPPVIVHLIGDHHGSAKLSSFVSEEGVHWLYEAKMQTNDKMYAVMIKRL